DQRPEAGRVAVAPPAARHAPPIGAVSSLHGQAHCNGRRARVERISQGPAERGARGTRGVRRIAITTEGTEKTERTDSVALWQRLARHRTPPRRAAAVRARSAVSANLRVLSVPRPPAARCRKFGARYAFERLPVDVPTGDPCDQV